MKKLLSIVLVIVIILSLSMVDVFAQGLYSDEINTFKLQISGGVTKVDIDWEDVKGALYYKVNIDTVTDYYDVKETVSDNSYDWAPDYFITPDMPFEIIVYAYDKNGSVIAQSETVTFYVGIVMCDYWGYYGDVDDDKAVTIIDCTLIQSNLAFKHTFGYFQGKKADVDGDGDISIIDASYIQLFCAQDYEWNTNLGNDLWVGAISYDIMFNPLG